MIVYDGTSGLVHAVVTGPTRPASEWITQHGAGTLTLDVNEFNSETDFVDVSLSPDAVAQKTASPLRSNLTINNGSGSETTITPAISTSEKVVYDIPSHFSGWDVRLYFGDDTFVRWGRVTQADDDDLRRYLAPFYDQYFDGPYLELDFVTVSDGVSYFYINEVAHLPCLIEISINYAPYPP
mgnify:CR=1 FL=1